MVTIITGNIHDGKTTKLIQLFESYKGDGFVSIKNMDGDYVKGFDYLQLSVKSTGPLATKEIIEPVRDVLGPYYFNEKAMTFIEEEMHEMVEQKVSPLYLDEVGKLELMDKGFHPLLKWIFNNMNAESHLYLSVRKPFLEDIIDKYELKDVTIINV